MRILIIGGCGYIGSALVAHLQPLGHDIATVDTEERGNKNATLRNEVCAYQELGADILDDFQVIIWVAGRSSVKAATANPIVAFRDNVSGLCELVEQLGMDQKFLWASSASVLSAPYNGHNNIYDATKRAAEDVVPKIYPNSYALRFATVCGASPNLRPDLVLNAMVKSALTEGVVNVANKGSRRPILGIRDLCRAVERIATGSIEPGTYNLASFNAVIGKLGEAVAARLGATIEPLPGTSGYDFWMDRATIPGWIPTETHSTIIESLVTLHAQSDLRSFK